MAKRKRNDLQKINISSLTYYWILCIRHILWNIHIALFCFVFLWLHHTSSFIYISQDRFTGTWAIMELPQFQWRKPEWHSYNGNFPDHRKHNKSQIMPTFLQKLYVHHPCYKGCIFVICYRKAISSYSYLHTSRMNWSLCMNSFSSWVEFYDWQFGSRWGKINKYWCCWHLGAKYHRCMGHSAAQWKLLD